MKDKLNRSVLFLGIGFFVGTAAWALASSIPIPSLKTLFSFRSPTPEIVLKEYIDRSGKCDKKGPRDLTADAPDDFLLYQSGGDFGILKKYIASPQGYRSEADISRRVFRDYMDTHLPAILCNDRLRFSRISEKSLGTDRAKLLAELEDRQGSYSGSLRFHMIREDEGWKVVMLEPPRGRSTFWEPHSGVDRRVQVPKRKNRTLPTVERRPVSTRQTVDDELQLRPAGKAQVLRQTGSRSVVLE